MHTWIHYYVDVKLRLTSLIALDRLFSLFGCVNDSCMHILEIQFSILLTFTLAASSSSLLLTCNSYIKKLIVHR